MSGAGASHRSARSVLITIGKIAISVTAIAIVFSQINLDSLLAHVEKLNVWVLAGTIALLLIEISLIGGLRVKLVLDGLGMKRSLVATSKVALSGSFFEQVAFGFVGGDAMRLWLLHRMKIPVRKAIQAIAIDRCLGLAALVLIALAGLPSMIRALTNISVREIMLGAGAALLLGSSIAILLVMRLTRPPRHPYVEPVVAWALGAIRNEHLRRCLLLTFALTMLTHILNVFIFFMLGRSLGIEIGLTEWFLIVPSVLLVSMLPISAGGWGLRELSMVVALGSLGVSSEEAIMPSIIFGVCLLAAASPGGLIWLAQGKQFEAEEEVLAEAARHPFANPPDEPRAAVASGGLLAGQPRD